MQLFVQICVMAVVAMVANGQACPGGAKQGDEVVSGAYYYKCDGGNLVPAGCMDDSSTKVPVSSTFNSGKVQKTCQNNGGTLTVKCTACLSNGQVIQPGSTADGTSTYSTCTANGEAFDLQVAGCIVSGQKTALDATITQGDISFTCQKTSSTDAKLVASGCVSTGQTYPVGQQFDTPDAFYHCKKTGDTVTKDPIGCIADGKHVYDLDLYKKGDQYYRCRVKDTAVSADLWGCALVKDDGTIEPKSIACTWDSGSDPINYVNCCINKGGNAVITQLYCLYTNMGGRIQVNEGCYRIFDKTAAGCQRQTDGSLKMTTWATSDLTGAAAAGLHQC